MVDWNKKFKPEYDAVKTAIGKADVLAKDLQPVVLRLQKLMGGEGFEAGHEEALHDLRKKATAGTSQTKITEDKGLLQAVGAWTDGDSTTLNGDTKTRVAALKMLSHVYLLNNARSRKVWVHSLSDTFTDWPTLHMKDKVSQVGPAKVLLKSKNEHFSEQQKRYLGNTTFEAVAWCQ